MLSFLWGYGRKHSERIVSGRMLDLMLFSCSPGVGSLFHMADDVGRAMESLVNVMTEDGGN